MYTALAPLYDRLMDDVDYASWAEYYRQLVLLHRGDMPRTLYEGACGTGALTVHLARWGCRLTASDLSAQMLSAAGERLRHAGVRLPLVRADLRAIETPRRVDAIVVCCDGVNYLTTDEDFSAFARSAYASLSDGGVLLFDVSTREKLQGMHEQTYCDEREDLAAVWKNTFDRESACLTMDVSLFVEEDSGLYRRLNETHVQRGYRKEELHTLLTQAGFSTITFYGDQTFTPPQEGCMRMHVAALRPKA